MVECLVRLDYPHNLLYVTRLFTELFHKDCSARMRKNALIQLNYTGKHAQSYHYKLCPCNSCYDPVYYHNFRVGDFVKHVSTCYDILFESMTKHM